MEVLEGTVAGRGGQGKEGEFHFRFSIFEFRFWAGEDWGIEALEHLARLPCQRLSASEEAAVFLRCSTGGVG